MLQLEQGYSLPPVCLPPSLAGPLLEALPWETMGGHLPPQPTSAFGDHTKKQPEPRIGVCFHAFLPDQTVSLRGRELCPRFRGGSPAPGTHTLKEGAPVRQSGGLGPAHPPGLSSTKHWLTRECHGKCKNCKHSAEMEGGGAAPGSRTWSRVGIFLREGGLVRQCLGLIPQVKGPWNQAF